MSYLVFWQSGIVLAMVPVLHWLLLRRPFSVSGRYSALVDRLRDREPVVVEPELSQEDLLAAVRAATADAFGADALEAMPSATLPSAATPAALRPAQSTQTHVMFFVGLCGGGLLSVLLGPGFVLRSGLQSTLFTRFFGGSPVVQAMVLMLGGLLVGFGTRMSGGCTSGHGLCGVSQMQKGSWLATAAFFGTGIVVSFALQLMS